MKQKTIAILTVLALLAVCLCGCGKQAETATETQTPAPAESAPSETAAHETEPDAAAAGETEEDPEEAARRAKYQRAYEKYEPDTVVMLINNQPITWSQYFTWIYDVASAVESQLDITDWSEPCIELIGAVDDATPNSYVASYALGYTIQVAVIGQKAAEYGVTVSPEEAEQLQATLDGYVERFGGQEAFEALLADAYMTPDYFREQNEAMILIDNIYEMLYGPSGEKLPEEDIVSYMKDSGYLYAKHILFKTVDDSLEPLPEDEIAEKKAEAEGVLAELRACTPEELPARFDALMQQYSEDTGMIAYPDGYYFVSGQMVPSFEAAVLELEENGVSDLVESDYGFHIIYCPPMRSDHIMEYDSNNNPYDIRSYAAARLFDKMAADWFDEAEQKVVYVGDFYTLDLNELFS